MYEPRGYIALISAIIISTVLLTLTTTVSAVNFAGRENALYSEFKHTANGLAESCINQALLNIAADYMYTVTTPTVVTLSGGLECSIESVTFGTETNHQKTFNIRTKGEFRGSYSALEVNADATDPSASPYDRGTILVRVAIINDDDGGASANATHITVPIGGSAYPASFDGDVYWRTVSVDAGSYGIQASAIPSYTLSTSGCSGTVADGEVKQCTFTFDDTPTTGKITMNVIIINNDGGGLTSMPITSLVLAQGSTVINPLQGIPTTYAPGSYTLTGTAPSGYHIGGYTGNCNAQTLAAGGSLECTVTFDDNPPPAPTCANTVMMLDRTGSMTDTDLANERAAAISLKNLYDTLNPNPKMAIGRFGAIPASAPYTADLLTGLTIDYSNFDSLINAGIVRNPISGTNIASAIDVAQAALVADTSINPQTGQPWERVLILVSDGEATYPQAGGGSTPTAWKFPTTNTDDVLGDGWTQPAGVYGVGEALDDGARKQRYSGFDFSAVPSGATIDGIEVRTNGYSSPADVAVTAVLMSDSFGASLSTSNDVVDWEETGTESGSATVAQAFTATGNDAISPDGGRFAKINQGEWICRSVSAASYSDLSLEYFVRGDTDATIGNTGYVEVKANTNLSDANCANSTGWTQVASHPIVGNGGSWSVLQGASIPPSFDNQQFLLKFRNASTGSTGKHWRVDGVKVKAGFQHQNCALGFDTSWDSGVTWTSKKVTPTLAESSATYTLGGSSDTWGHTWTEGEVKNPFRLRMSQELAGPTCVVDTLEARMHYSVASSGFANAAATASANAAKAAGTEIFTIHFGDAGTGNENQNFLASLATNSTNGSGNSSSNIIGDPQGQTVDTGGDNNGFEVNVGNAFSDDGFSAENTDGAGDRHRFFGYDLTALPPNAIINGIVVEPNWWVDATGNSTDLSVTLSWNGGTSWTSVSRSDSGESTNTSHVGTIGGSSDTWGRTWSVGDFSSSNFVVRVTMNSSAGTRDFYLDSIPVRVYYTTLTENGDGDNFFISPTSADMDGIFDHIGAKVCPAAAAPPIVTTPTSGTINVLTNVVNDSGTGNKHASDFISVIDDSGAIIQFAGNETPPGSSVIVQNLHTYTVGINGSHEGYSMSISPASCASGTMVAGTVLNCTITLDDVPIPTPPPPPPPPAIDIGSWKEI
ncbi:MAG: hypothetical protein RLZZ283_388 [Candidatus Parcubacteria bacterium]|jgi:hypothetical protein